MAGQIVTRGKNTWLVRIYRGLDEHGKRRYVNKTVHGTKKDAEAWLTAALRERDLGQFDGLAEHKVRMKQLFDLVLLDYEKNAKDRSWADGVIRVRLEPHFGGLLASEVTTEVIDRYTVAQRASGHRNATINRALALLKRAFNLGRRSTPPLVFKVPHIPMLKENNVRKGFFEWEEIERLRTALPAELRPVLIFAFYTGCRKQEILSLRWDQVDMLERTVRLDPGETKNDEARSFVLPSEVYEMLKFLREDRDTRYPQSPWVFSRDGERIKDFRRSWEVACSAVGLVKPDGTPSKLFHDLRRSGVRNLVRAGVPERIAMAISGHKSRSVFDRYNIVSGSDLKEAARRLDGYVDDRKAAIQHTIRTQAPNERKTVN